MSRIGQAFVLTLGLLAAAFAGYITLNQRADDRLQQAILTVRTYNFDGTVRGRLDPYFQAHPQEWSLDAEPLDDAVRVVLQVGESRYAFKVSDKDVTPLDESTREFVEGVRAWARKP